MKYCKLPAWPRLHSRRNRRNINVLLRYPFKYVLNLQDEAATIHCSRRIYLGKLAAWFPTRYGNRAWKDRSQLKKPSQHKTVTFSEDETNIVEEEKMKVNTLGENRVMSRSMSKPIINFSRISRNVLLQNVLLRSPRTTHQCSKDSTSVQQDITLKAQSNTQVERKECTICICKAPAELESMKVMAQLQTFKDKIIGKKDVSKDLSKFNNALDELDKHLKRMESKNDQSQQNVLMSSVNKCETTSKIKVTEIIVTNSQQQLIVNNQSSMQNEEILSQGKSGSEVRGTTGSGKDSVSEAKVDCLKTTPETTEAKKVLVNKQPDVLKNARGKKSQAMKHFSPSNTKKNDESARKVTITPEFEKQFHSHSRRRNGMNSGVVITKYRSNLWLKKAGVFEDTIDEEKANELFLGAAETTTVLNIHNYVRYLQKLTLGSSLKPQDLIELLSKCPKAADKPKDSKSRAANENSSTAVEKIGNEREDQQESLKFGSNEQSPGQQPEKPSLPITCSLPCFSSFNM